MYYVLSGGENPFDPASDDVTWNIYERRHLSENINEEAKHLLSAMLSINKTERPCVSDVLR